MLVLLLSLPCCFLFAASVLLLLFLLLVPVDVYFINAITANHTCNCCFCGNQEVPRKKKQLWCC